MPRRRTPQENLSETMPDGRRHMLVYVSFLKILACLLFFFGFFSFKPHYNDVASLSDMPTFVNDVPLNVSELYKRRYSRMVFMVIDALRYDFVANGNRMPFLNEKLRNNETSCLLSATTGVPTVTLPRIKALTSGTVPGFLDVIFNFGSTEFMDDNLIHQAVTNNLKIVFYGDDTWLHLFPYAFTRSEGTPSFFVNDFYEVDAVVTKNVMKELSNTDWDIMVLHYLGLDHIGHVEGPFGKSITPKLKEMDNVISLIMDSFRRKGEEILLVITGDHGMKDSGGHGGSSYEEITVPLVLLNAKCDDSLGDHSFHQVDMAPLLSILMGIPVPASSAGRVSPKWFASLSLHESLYAAYYNSLRMGRTLVPTLDQELEDEMGLAMELLASYFTSNSSTENKRLAEQAFTHMFKAQNKIFSKFTTSNEVMLGLLIPAMGLIVQSMALLFVDVSASMPYPIDLMGITCWSFTLIGVVVLSIMRRFSLTESDLNNGHVMLCPLLGCVLLFNVLLLVSSKFTLKIFENADKLFLLLSGLLPLTYLSTSFIEEEHMYWYFTFVTFVSWAAIHDIDSLKELFVVITIQRALKNFNYTGDKWSGGTDIGDWLKENDNRLLRMSTLVIGSLLSIFTNWEIGWSPSIFSVDLIFLLLQGLASLWYQLATNGLWMSFSNGTREVNFFWAFTACRLVFAVYRLCREKEDTPYKVLIVIVQLHLSIIALFMDGHNVVLVPCLMLFSRILRETVENPWQLIVLHYWLGEVFFFYMGNSNSISTINVTVGFIGLEEFHLGLAVIYVFLNTYAFPILSYLMLMANLLDIKRTKTGGGGHFQNMMSSMYLLLNGVPLAVFMIVIFFHREHLFIWSVFAPKLLYLMVHTVLIITLTMSTIFL